MDGQYSQFEEVLAIARRILESDEECRRFIAEKQKKLGSEYTISLDTIVLKPGGREATLRALFSGRSEGCEIVLDVDRELVRLIKNYLGDSSRARS